MATTAMFLTPCVTQIVLLHDEMELGRATGFFLKVDGSWYLVSNWHVFSGRNPATGQPRDATGAVPNSCIFFKAILSESGIEWHPIRLSLGDAVISEAIWLQHSVHGQDVDIAVMPIKPDHIGASKDILDRSGHDADMLVDLGAEVFLPGYPLGLTGGGRFPLWKRGSLASSLEWGAGVEKFFYVDTASREGMSGSPCFAISNWQHYRLDRMTGKVSVVQEPLSWRFLGVYSGRLNVNDDLGAQIGLVWRGELVFDIVKGMSPGQVRLI